MRLSKTSTAMTSDNRVRTARRKTRFVLRLLMLGLVLVGLNFAVNSGVFTLKKIVVYGNRHLGHADVVRLMELPSEPNLAKLDLGRVYESLHSSAWVRSVKMRKELPDTLEVRIEESKPVALLQSGEGLFIVDAQGILLERVHEAPVYFLPVIVNERADDSHEFIEAVRLAEVINDMSEARAVELVEIAGLEGGTENMLVRLDGTDIKVGRGGYREKLARYFDLSEEIDKRNIDVDYIDLRFANRVVVKPLEEAVQ